MQHVGVYDKLRAQGYNYEELVLSNGYGQELAKFLNGSEKLYNFSALRLNRKKVQKALLDEAEAQGIQVCYDMKLTGVEENTESGVKLTFENGHTATADFVVGTDGIHSRVRPSVTSIEPVYSGHFGITGIMGKDQLHRSHQDHYLPNMFFGQSGFMAVLPSSFHGTEVGFFSTMEFPERTRAQWEELANRPNEIQEILSHRFTASWPDFIQGICEDVAPATLASWP